MKLEQMRRAFFWKYSQGQAKKMHLLKWNLVCRPYKEEGGLGLVPFKSEIYLYWQNGYDAATLNGNLTGTCYYPRDMACNLMTMESLSGLNTLSLMVSECVNLTSNVSTNNLLQSSSFKWRVRNGNI